MAIAGVVVVVVAQERRPLVSFVCCHLNVVLSVNHDRPVGRIRNLVERKGRLYLKSEDEKPTAKKSGKNPEERYIRMTSGSPRGDLCGPPPVLGLSPGAKSATGPARA